MSSIKFYYLGWPPDHNQNHNGVLTLAVRHEPRDKQVEIGFSFCSPKDSFSRKEGRKLAVCRLEEMPLRFKYLYEYRRTFREVVKALCHRDFDSLQNVAYVSPLLCRLKLVPCCRKGGRVVYEFQPCCLVPGWARKWYEARQDSRRRSLAMLLRPGAPLVSDVSTPSHKELLTRILHLQETA